MPMTDPMVICKNCGLEVSSKFCGNCGQRQFERFTVAIILDNLSNSFNINRGFPHTFLALLIRPGSFLKEYYGGKTKSYTNPFSYYFLISAFVVIIMELGKDTDSAGSDDDILKYMPYIFMILIPTSLALGNYVTIGLKYTFLEHLISGIYLTANWLLISIILLRSIKLIPEYDVGIGGVYLVLFSVLGIYYLWFSINMQLYKPVNLILRTSGGIVVMIIYMFIISMILITILMELGLYEPDYSYLDKIESN